jgi:myo-inositol-1(or 4)-monophosphatase
MIKKIVDITERAGLIIEEVRKTAFSVEQKGSMGPVTEADRQADEFLKKELLAMHPVGWLSEETADNPDRLSLDSIWVVDPLDGTKEFVEGVPQYTVAVSLVENGEPVFGVVHNPANGETAYATRGEGAWKKEGGATSDTYVRASVSESSIILASRSEMKRGEFGPFAGDWDIQAVGSIEYKLALIGMGEGAATLSRGPKWEWDVCAGALIVEEAGGSVTDAFGDRFNFNQEFPKVKGVIAGAPTAYKTVLKEVSAMGQSDRMDEFKNR